MPWENTPNMENEKPNNSLSMIDRFAENGSQHISGLLDNRYHHNNREERSNVTLQKISVCNYIELAICLAY